MITANDTTASWQNPNGGGTSGQPPAGTMQQPNTNSASSPWGWSGSTPPGGFGSPVTPPSTSQPGGAGMIPYTPGPITSVVNNLLTAAIGGTSTPGPAQSLNLFSRGIIPPALEQQYRQNLDQSMADITERMGVTGNRFGTDLSRTLADAAGRADVNLSAGAMDRALAAIQQILGLGTAQSGLEFTGNQAALDRSHQDFLQSNQQSSFESLLPLLLGI